MSERTNKWPSTYVSILVCSRARCSVSVHFGPEQPKIQTEVLGHSLLHSHRSLVCLLRTARFARALRCAHLLARSLTLLTLSLMGQ